MSRTSTECPWCLLPVIVPRGRWTYRRSQVVLHLVACSQRPAHLPSAALNTTADILVDHLTDEPALLS